MGTPVPEPAHIDKTVKQWFQGMLLSGRDRWFISYSRVL